MLNCARMRHRHDRFFSLVKVETTYTSLLVHLCSYKCKTLFKTIQNIDFICLHLQ